MKNWAWTWRILTVGFAAALLGGCATYPYQPYYTVHETPAAAAPPQAESAPPSLLTVGPEDQFYFVHVDNHTGFTISFPQTNRVLYEKGYDRARREREADFALNISIATEARDNPDARAEHMLGGALLGAAAGALIGAAAGAPVTGTIAGAAGGGVLGLAAPADTAMIRIDVQTQSYRDGATSSRSVVLDMANVPPYDAPRVVDIQISKMLETLPTR